MIWNPEAECMPRQPLEELQLKRLQAMCHRVYEKVPAYKKKFDEASDRVDAAIVSEIYENPAFGTGVPETLYGDVFGLALNLSYFLWEVGNYPGAYCPPVDLSEVGVTCTGKTP